MSTVQSIGTPFNASLQGIMDADDVAPGTDVGYETCKALWQYHPLGGKIVEKPITLAQTDGQTITVAGVAEDEIVEAFHNEWKGPTDYTAKARDVMHIARAYGGGALVFGFPDLPTDQALGDWFELQTRPGLYFNLFDPLNLVGSTITNQNPNAPDFQKPQPEITAAGQPYHPSRSITVFNGTPIYLAWQSSSFSYSGRSVFQRALFSLKTYLQVMKTTDMASVKAGLLVAKTKQNTSIVDRMVEKFGAVKRAFLKEAKTGQVLQVGENDTVESLNLQNLDGTIKITREHNIADISAETDVPAILLKDEAYAQGFSDGEQDMMNVVQFINHVRGQMGGVYDYLNRICCYRAWTPALFETLQAKYPDALGGKDYKAWFFECRARFKATWPSLIQEPEGEKTERNAKKLKAIADLFKVLNPGIDPANGAKLRQWIVDAVNGMPELFDNIMDFDPMEFESWAQEMQDRLQAQQDAAAAGGGQGDGGGGDGD